MHDQKRATRDEVIDEVTRKRREAIFKATGKLYTSQFEKRADKVYTREALAENAQLLQDVPEGYVMYNYRREILLHLFAPTTMDTTTTDSAHDTETATDPVQQHAVWLGILKDEIKFNTTILLKDFKNYFAFVHRHWIFEQLFALAQHEAVDDAETETLAPAQALLQRVLEAERQQCETLLDLDERNFHVWNHRRYVLAALHRAESICGGMTKHKTDAPGASPSVPGASALFTPEEAGEMAYTATRINRNFSNYSTWHQRSLIIQSALRRHGIQEAANPSADTASPSPSATVWLDLYTVLHEDVERLIQAIYCDPNDQSAWFYAPFVLDLYRVHAAELRKSAETQNGLGGTPHCDEDVLDLFVSAVADLIVEEVRLNEDEDCYLPLWFLLTLLVRLHENAQTPDAAAERHDAVVRCERYTRQIANVLIPDAPQSPEKATLTCVVKWLHARLVRTDPSRGGMYDHLMTRILE